MPETESGGILQTKMPTALLDAGINAHPTCGPDAQLLMGATRA